VPRATEAIETGVEVTVDGAGGVVTLTAAPAASTVPSVR
jgi:hypothetical protein